jgi:hypothetical protein
MIFRVKKRSFVGYLDGLSERDNELRQLQAKSQVELDALLPSVLDRAFKPLQDASQGEL